MTYAIAKSSSRPQGGFLEFSNDEWEQDALKRGYGAEYNSMFRGNLGTPIELDKVPSYVVVRKPRPELPDMFWGQASLLVVSGAYHDIIERLDPGLHQMWPIEMRRKRKGPYPGRWYGLNIRPRAKAISPAESDTKIAKGSERLGTPDHIRVQNSFKVAVRKDALPDVNLWWDDGLDGPVILCSDALRDAVVAEGLKSIPLIKAKEVCAQVLEDMQTEILRHTCGGY